MSSVIFNNFVRGKLDEDLSGRFDLPVFTNGFPVVQNFISNYKGVLKYRTGFEYIADVVDAKSKLIEFKFNTGQSYLMVITLDLIKFYTYDADGNFGYVCEIQNDHIVPDVKYHTQNADAMILGLGSYIPYILKRTSAEQFVLEEFNVTGLKFVVSTSESPTDKDALVNPKCAVFHKGRLWFANGYDKTTTIFASKVADYDQFTIPTSDIKDDDAFSLTLTDISDPIEWLYGGKNNLLVGNGEGITIVNGGSPGVSVTSTKVNADLGNKEGSSKASPTEKDSQMLYVGVDKKRVYAFDYDLVSEKFVSSDLNLLCEDIPDIEEIYYKRDRNDLVYGRTADGQMIALLYNKAENIFGWFPLRTKGFVHNMCSVTRPDGQDDLFISVTRDGQHYIERLSDEIDYENIYNADTLSDVDMDKDALNKKTKLLGATYLDSWEYIESEQEEGGETGEITAYKGKLVDFYNQTGCLLSSRTDVEFDISIPVYMQMSFSDGSGLNLGSTIPDKYITKDVIILYNYPEGEVIKVTNADGEEKIITPEQVYRHDFIFVKNGEQQTLWDVYLKQSVVFALINPDDFFDMTDDALTYSYVEKRYNGIRYISGYEGLEGVVLSVFANGGYLGKAIVNSDGVLDIGREVKACVVGYPYLGIAKTFNIGSWMDGVNFQTVKKRVVSFVVRFVNSGSFKIGTSLDNLQQMQEFSTTDKYDSAPAIMNGDRFVYGYNDDHSKEKCLYLVQDEPVPCNITMVECNVTFNKMD